MMAGSDVDIVYIPLFTLFFFFQLDCMTAKVQEFTPEKMIYSTCSIAFYLPIYQTWSPLCKTNPVRSVCTAAASDVSSSLATRSPISARQSSIEVSGLVGVNTSDERRSKPVVEKAANMQTTGQNDFSHSAAHLKELFALPKRKNTGW